jgi:hypothetical protein
MQLRTRIANGMVIASALAALLGIAHGAKADRIDCNLRTAEKSADEGEQSEVPLECVRITLKSVRETYCQVKKGGKVKTTKVATAQDCLRVRGKVIRKSKVPIGLLQKPMN